MDKVNEAYWRGYHNGYACAMEDNAQLTIVRCKDCKWQNIPMCWITNKPSNGFCSLGERKDNADN